MSWHGIHGHDEIVEQFRRALRRGRLASSFLFAGPAGVGKRTFALKLAQAMLCETRLEETLDPCNACPACAQVLAGTHPDVLMVARPEGKSEIPVELFIGDDEHRRREGLLHDINLKPHLGSRRIAVIDDADYLNPPGANALLKVLEEPPPRSLLILIGTSAAKQLPTIRSRCQLVRFQPLSATFIAELLMANGIVADAAEAQRLAERSEGSIRRATELAGREFWLFRNSLCEQLSQATLNCVGLVKNVSSFVDEAGKEATARRARLQQVVAFATEFYRQLLRRQCSAALSEDRQMQSHVARAVEQGYKDSEATVRRLDTCLDVAAAIDRYVNQATLIEYWIDSLASA